MILFNDYKGMQLLKLPKIRLTGFFHLTVDLLY